MEESGYAGAEVKDVRDEETRKIIIQEKRGREGTGREGRRKD
jgi:hypothetical protein